jgi:hypothetical protein
MKKWYVTIEGDGEAGELKVLTEQFCDKLEDSGLFVARATIGVHNEHVIVGPDSAPGQELHPDSMKPFNGS